MIRNDHRAELKNGAEKLTLGFDRQLLCVSFQPFVLSQLSAAIVHTLWQNKHFCP